VKEFFVGQFYRANNVKVLGGPVLQIPYRERVLCGPVYRAVK